MAKSRPPAPVLSPGQLEQICKVLGHTGTGLTGSEIGALLRQARVKDTHSDLTKWKRLYNALGRRQTMDGNADRTLAFIRLALDPARYSGNRAPFDQRCSGVNAVLSYVGLEFQEDGRFHRVKAATTLSESEKRANRLRVTLEARNVHADLLAFCRAELLVDNYFHAVLEAMKSIAEKLRKKGGYRCDGAPLVDASLGGKDPAIRLNDLRTDSEWSEQRGFANLVKGLFGTFRNPTAHAPRVEWDMPEQDALDLLSVASYVHRRLDSAR